MIAVSSVPPLAFRIEFFLGSVAAIWMPVIVEAKQPKLHRRHCVIAIFANNNTFFFDNVLMVTLFADYYDQLFGKCLHFSGVTSL